MSEQHQHEWRNWPYSKDALCCLGCGYMIVGDLHYPNGKWVMPPIPVSSDPATCKHAAFKSTDDGFQCVDCDYVAPPSVKVRPMPRYSLNADERYPDWSLSKEEDSESYIDLTAEEFADYDRVVEEYESWQTRIEQANDRLVYEQRLQEARDFKAGRLTEADMMAKWPTDYSSSENDQRDRWIWRDRYIRDIKKLAETLPEDSP